MATHDFGMTLASSTTDGSYTTLARIIDLGEAKLTIKKIMIPILANTTNKSMAGTITYEDLPFTVEFNKTDFATVEGYATARSTRWWKVTDTDGNIWKGQAFITEFTQIPKFGEDDRLKYAVSLARSDANWTFTAV